MESMFLDYFTKEIDFPFFIQYGYHDKDVSMHVHAGFSELVIVLNGKAVHIVNKESYFIKKGDVFVINQDTVHGYQKTNEFQMCNIMYQPEAFLDFDADIRKLSGFHALFVIEPFLAKVHSFKSRLTLQPENFVQVSDLLEAMMREYEKMYDGWNTMLSSQFKMLSVMLSRLYSLPSKKREINGINLAKSVSYMENHYKEPYSLEKLAELSHLSARHFTRLFKETYQVTPGMYLLSLQMQHAAYLLKTTSLNISEIAYQVGFSDNNYFSRRFHQYFHMTPKEYRKRSL